MTWKKRVRLASLTVLLFAPALLLSQPSLPEDGDKCRDGGPGATQCSNSNCSVTCSGNTYACCNTTCNCNTNDP